MFVAPETRAIRDLQGLLHMIDRIYAAACGETPWDRAVEQVCRLGGFDGCTLSSVDPLDRRSVILSCHGLGAMANGGAPGIPPRSPLLTDSVLRSAPGALWQDHQVISPALLETTSFWTDWMLPNGFVTWACVIIGKSEDRVACLEVYARPQRAPIGPEAAHRLIQLAPHLVRAWRLGGRDEERRQASGAADSGPEPRFPVAGTASEPAASGQLVRLRGEFGLTKAEARLALALASGWSLAQAATEFDVKRTTIRTHLQQVFAKTGTSRQAELVVMMLGRGYGGRTETRNDDERARDLLVSVRHQHRDDPDRP